MNTHTAYEEIVKAASEVATVYKNNGHKAAKKLATKLAGALHLTTNEIKLMNSKIKDFI